MHRPAQTEIARPWVARTRTLALAVAGCLAIAGVVLLFPADSPRAAGDDAGTDAKGDSSNFGSATPTDRFIQSFQQQVSQQLQSALAQSNQMQEERLRQFEQQQKELGDQLQSIQQSIEASGPSAGRAAVGASGDQDPGSPATGLDSEPPHVNSRRPQSGDAAAESHAAVASAASLFGVGEDSTDESAGGIGGGIGAYPRPTAVSFAGGARPGRPGDPDIAPHGFVEGRLLNGVVAVLGGPDRESIVALRGDYQSANGFSTDLDGCFALVQGRPEIAAGRIDFKLSRLTCNFHDGASRTWDAAGWLVDGDGIRGVRATIVENVGRKAIAAAAGGAIGGVGQRLSQEQYQINTISGSAGGPVSGSSSTFIGSTGLDAAGGAASGAANAIGQSITEYYNLFTPSLQVGGGTPVTVVLANDLRLPPSGHDITQTHLATP